MTFKRPDITYTAMAMWVDENAYLESCNDELLYEYIYHIADMLARKAEYFHYASEYDEFALYVASRVYFRLKNPKQFQLAKDGEPKLKKVKSILNYLKKVIYPCKADYDIEFGSGSPDATVIQLGSFDVGEHLSLDSNLFDQFDRSYAYGDIIKTVKQHLLRIPVRKNSAEWHNIYLSCLLTLINSTVLTHAMIKRIDVNQPQHRDQIVEKFYKELRSQPPVLYHLPDTMSTYIVVLTNEIRHVVSDELGWKTNLLIPADVPLKRSIFIQLQEE